MKNEKLTGIQKIVECVKEEVKVIVVAFSGVEGSNESSNSQSSRDANHK